MTVRTELFTARVARFCLPGKMWYIAACEDCRWVGLSWKDKKQAIYDRDQHNEKHLGEIMTKQSDAP